MLFASPCFTADAAGQEPGQCGPEDEKNEIVKPKKKEAVPAPSPGKAMVVVMRAVIKPTEPRPAR